MTAGFVVEIDRDQSAKSRPLIYSVRTSANVSEFEPIASRLSRLYSAVPLSKMAQKSAITRPLQLHLGSTLWRIDNNTFANDLVYRLPVYVGLDNFEFERVISGQRLAGLRWQQLGPSLNIKSCMSGAVMIGVPHFDPGLKPTSAN